MGGWYTDRLDIIDSIVEWHQTKAPVAAGVIDAGKVVPEIKTSLDASLFNAPEELQRAYFDDVLQVACEEYIKLYPMCNFYSAWRITDDCNIQYYPPGGGFYKWHSERTSAMHPSATRHLVFMTYLNDVPEDGETEFYHQNVKIKPEKGLTVIWPSDWTFTHRGLPSQHDKFIATGWWNFTDD